MRFAYADPPYIGVANRYPEQQEVGASNTFTLRQRWWMRLISWLKEIRDGG